MNVPGEKQDTASKVRKRLHVTAAFRKMIKRYR